LLGKRTILRVQDNTGCSQKRVVTGVAHLIFTDCKDVDTRSKLSAAGTAVFANRFQAALEILCVGERPFIDDYHIDNKTLRTPIFVRFQEVPQGLHVGFIIDAQRKDREVTGDRHRPKLGLAAEPICNVFGRHA
jgi:hypothetical protein